MIRVTVEKLPEDGSHYPIATAVIADDGCAGLDAIVGTYKFSFTTLPWVERGNVDHPYDVATGRVAFMRSQSVWRLIADAIEEAERKGEL